MAEAGADVARAASEAAGAVAYDEIEIADGVVDLQLIHQLEDPLHESVLALERAEDRLGETASVLVEGNDEDRPDLLVGRAEHQGPEVDGVCLVSGASTAAPGATVRGVVTGADGVDLLVEAQ